MELGKQKNKIYCRHQPGCGARLDISTIRKAAGAVLREEGLPVPCEINVFIVGDAEIREHNRTYRDIDAATDVISFPQQHLKPGSFTPSAEDMTANNGTLPLGDIFISAQRVEAQAAEIGHSLGRETAYLVIHSVLHLLGYDHADPEDKKLMRAREEEIIGRL
ncbi:MAG: rRNA maturation RNase YbeY [Oscillospiraceae bacterium]|jgi:probable rRNA maturation factor|nr:rRNA maturation RNase YbeY [Oscillospiraceae bacterium]